METENSCGNCKHTAEIKGNVEKVQCRVSAPTTHLINTQQGVGIMSPYPWPIMDASADWCGQHEPGAARSAPRIVRLTGSAAAGLKAVK